MSFVHLTRSKISLSHQTSSCFHGNEEAFITCKMGVMNHSTCRHNMLAMAFIKVGQGDALWRIKHNPVQQTILRW